MTARTLTDNQRAVLMTRMSDQTAGQVLGWSAARVRRERVAVVEVPAAEALVVPTPPPELAPQPVAIEQAPVVVAFPPPHPDPRPKPYDPVGPRKLRFSRWFIRAGWSVAETAHLFDLYPHELGAALDRDVRRAG
jgi:hypothetical protein